MNFPPKASSMHQGDSGATCWFEGFTTSDLYHHDHPRNLGQGPFVNTSIQNNNSLLWGCVVKLYVHTMYVFWYWFIFKYIYISIFMNMQDALSLMCFSIRLTLHMSVHSKVPVEFAFAMVLRRYFFRLEIQVDHEKWRALLYAISFLHSIVQERRKFGAIGWCVPYEFNNSDLDASLLFLEKHMSSTIMVGLQLSWNTIQYMVAEVQYGGRITDDLDRELFITYAAKWLVEGMFGPSFTFNTYSADYNYEIPKGAVGIRYDTPA